MPSLAFCLLISYLLIQKAPKFTGRYYKYALTAFLIVLVLFSYKTISRNKVWESNQTLFEADVITSSGSAKSNYDYAISLSDQAEKIKNEGTRTELYERSLLHLRKALTIYPKYTAALVSYADINFKYKLNADTAIFYYEKALSVNPMLKSVNNTLGTLYGQYKANYDRAIIFFNKDIAQNKPSADTYKKMAMCYFYKKDTANALIFADKGLKLDPQNPELIQLRNLCDKSNGH